MIFLNELKDKIVYKRPFYLPINYDDKKNGSLTFLLTPNYNSTVNLLNNPLIGHRYYYSYFIEKNIVYYINQEGFLEEDEREYIQESVKDYIIKKKYKITEKLFYNPDKLNKIIEDMSKEPDAFDELCSLARTCLEIISVGISEILIYSGEPLMGSLGLIITAIIICKTGKDSNYKLAKLKSDIIQRMQYIKKLISKEDDIEVKNKYKEDFSQLQKCVELIDKKLKDIITESVKEQSNLYLGKINNDYVMESTHARIKTSDNEEMLFLFNEGQCNEIVNEANSKLNPALKKILYNNRFRTPKEVLDLYKQVKLDAKWIRYTYIDIERYKNNNLLVDLSHYNQTFTANNMLKLDRGVNLYFEFLTRFLNDNRFKDYKSKTVIIPIDDYNQISDDIFDYKVALNPISMIFRLIKSNPTMFNQWKGIDFVFVGRNNYFKLNFNDIQTRDIPSLKILFNKMKLNKPDDTSDGESPKAIISNIVDKIESNKGIKINNFTGKSGEITKDELIQKIDKAASVSKDEKETLDELDKDKYIANILNKLAEEDDNQIKISVARTARIDNVSNEFLNKKVNNKSIKEIIETKDIEELPSMSLNIDSINDEWKDLKFINFEKSYDMSKDIYDILYSFSKKSYPIAVRDINVENTSTSEDLKQTYIVKMEDFRGKRFTVKFDVPIYRDNKFMVLRGNEKMINGQLILLPISKTDSDTVQMVSNYSKIFIGTYGSPNKSCVVADRINKSLSKGPIKGIKIANGDNSKICAKYELPIDYIDMAKVYSKISTTNYTFFFNQDEIRKNYKNIIDLKKGLPIGYNRSNNTIIYFPSNYKGLYSNLLYSYLSENDEFNKVYDNTNTSVKYHYSKARIMRGNIPLVILMSYYEGLIKSMQKANIKYELVEKRPSIDKNTHDYIQFSDGYIIYQIDYNSSLLMNGLKESDTASYSLNDINNKAMYLELLDNYGGRLLADGLDNFYDCFIDSITEKVLERYKLPTDFVELLAYANLLLSDNKYIKHTDTSSNRYRSNEIVAGYVYKSLSKAYGSYANMVRKGKTDATMSMKQSEIIDSVLSDPTSSDASILNPLTEIESINTVSYKGLSGMNADRSYSLDKRTFDESMLNLLGMSTGFAANVGINRQTTIDMNIEGSRGYLKINKDPKDFSITKTFTASEALTPFGATRDDPFRSAMTFIQTSKHGMRIKKGSPNFITNGMDEALPYLITNTFAFKSKEAGKVIEITDNYMILEYNNGKKDLVDLRENIKKNSNGGFFTGIKLDTDLKVGSKFKANEIVAYDKLSFSDKIGSNSNIAYNIGAMAKCAIMSTDEGFEDSAIISESLSEDMSSDVIICKEVVLPKDTNILHIVKKGQPIEEGDDLIIYQHAFDDADMNLLLKNLADSNDISDIGRIPLKSKVTGIVQDIKIYRTVEKEELSESLKNVVTKIESPAKGLERVISKNNIETPIMVEPTYKLEASGKLKNAQDGVKIEFYLKYNDKMSVGDKLIYYSALKGVIKDIFPKGEEPYTDSRPDEEISSLLSVSSVDGRMVCSVLLNGAINKTLIELDRKVKTIAGIPFKYLNED